MELRGALRISKFKKTEAQPKYYGSAEINGKTYTLKGWEKQGKDGMWISILFEEAEEAFSNMTKEAKVEHPREHHIPDLGGLGEDDIPF